MNKVIRVGELELDEDEVRRELLADAKTRPVRHLLQIDAYQHVTPSDDPTLVADEDGDCLQVIERLELRRFDGVRVQVPIGHDRSDAARVLRKIAAWLETSLVVDDVEANVENAPDDEV